MNDRFCAVAEEFTFGPVENKFASDRQRRWYFANRGKIEAKKSKSQGAVVGGGGGAPPPVAATAIPQDATGQWELVDPATGAVLGEPMEAAELRQAVQESAEMGDPLTGVTARPSTSESQRAEAERRERAMQEIEAKNAEYRRQQAMDPRRPGGREWVEPPEKLYHATYAGEKIAQEGLKTAEQLGPGSDVLGGVAQKSISFTTRENAETYRQGLDIARRAARGEIDPDDRQQLEQIAKEFNVGRRDLARILEENAPERSGAAGPAKRMFRILQGFSIAGQKFPLFMGGDWTRTVKEAAAPPSLVEIEARRPKNLSYNPGEQEWRVWDPENIGPLRVIHSAAPLANKFVSDKQRKWYFANRGREDVKSRAKGAASRAASLFGLPKPRVEFYSTGGEVFGEHGGDRVLIANPEKERNLGDTKVINFKPAPEVTDVEHVAAHEVIHQAFSQNPELGREMMDRLKNTKAEYGSAVSIYGSMAGSFENLMELGAVYTHSPRQLKKYSPEMHAIAADWSERLRGAVTNKFTSDKQRRWYFANADKGGQFGGGKKGVTVSPNLGIHPENARMIGETLMALGEKYGVSPEQMMTTSMQGGNALGHHSTGRRRQVTPEEREALKAQGVKTYGMDHPGSKQRRWFVFDPGHTLAFKSADSKGKPAGLGLPPDQLEKHMNSVKGLHARSGRPAAVDVATHEFAHILQHERGWKRADLNAPLSPAEQGTAKKISSYAATDRGELLAEAFVLFEGGNREPWVMDLVAQILPPTTNADPSPYGYCPICGAPGVERERRKDGNDRCANGHEYPSREAVGKPPVANKFVSDKQRRWYWSNLGKQGGPKEWRKGKAGGGAPRAFSMPGITTKPTDNGLTGEGEVDAQTRLAYLSISKMNGLTPDEVDGAHELEAMRVALEETRAFWTSNDPDARAIRRSDGLRSDPNSENSLNASLNIIMTADRENAGAGSGGPGSAKVFWTPYSMPDREGRLGPTYSHSLGVDPIYVLAHELHHAYGHGSEFDRASDVAAVAAHLRSGLKFNRKGVEDYLYTQVAVMQVYYGRSGDRGVRANETGRALRYLHNRFPEQLKQVLVGNILDEASWNQLLGQIQGIGKRRPAAT